MWAILLSIISQKRYLITMIAVFILYVLIYLAATQFFVFDKRVAAEEGFFIIKIAENWQELILNQRAPFLFEPIGILYLGGLKFFIAPINILIAALLGLLVALNISVSYYSFRTLALRGAQGIISLLGTIPAIIGGATCCVPLLILLIGLQLTATLVTVWSFFVPLSFILLIGTLVWALHRTEKKKF